MFTIVIPVFNEEELIPYLVMPLKEELEKTNIAKTLLFVNDGSTDRSLLKLREFFSDVKLENTKISILSHDKNYGHMKALETGLRHSESKFTITIDADMQDPLMLITEMINLACSQEPQVIQTVRSLRSTDSFFKRFTANFYYKLLNKVFNIDSIPNAADCRCLRSDAKEKILNRLNDSSVLRTLIPTLKFQTEIIYFDRQVRKAGKTKYSMKKMADLAINSVVGESIVPIRYMTITAMFSSLFLGITLIGILVLRFTNAHLVSGWASLVAILLLGFSLIIFCLGIIGEYILRIFAHLTPSITPNLVIENL